MFRWQQHIFPYTLFETIKCKIDAIRSFWIQGFFASCHKSVRFGKIGRLHGTKYISIGANSFFGDNFYLTTWPENAESNKDPIIKIGERCNFGSYNHITCTNKILIGNNVLTGKWVTISDNNHGDTSEETLHIPPCDRKVLSKGPVIIEDNVWIGDKATILSGVRIGEGTVIGANAVVTKDVPAYSIVIGNPMKCIIRQNKEHR